MTVPAYICSTFCKIVTIHFQNNPPKSLPFFVKISQRKYLFYIPIDLTSIIIYGCNNIVNFVCCCIHGGFPDLPFLDFAVAEEDVDARGALVELGGFFKVQHGLVVLLVLAIERAERDAPLRLVGAELDGALEHDATGRDATDLEQHDSVQFVAAVDEVRVGDSVPSEIPTFKLGKKGSPFKDKRLFDYRNYPADLYLAPGASAANRNALAKWGAWVNSLGANTDRLIKGFDDLREARIAHAQHLRARGPRGEADVGRPAESAPCNPAIHR